MREFCEDVAENGFHLRDGWRCRCLFGGVDGLQMAHAHVGVVVGLHESAQRQGDLGVGEGFEQESSKEGAIEGKTQIVADGSIDDEGRGRALLVAILDERLEETGFPDAGPPRDERDARAAAQIDVAQVAVEDVFGTVSPDEDGRAQRQNGIVVVGVRDFGQNGAIRVVSLLRRQKRLIFGFCDIEHGVVFGFKCLHAERVSVADEHLSAQFGSEIGDGFESPVGHFFEESVEDIGEPNRLGKFGQWGELSRWLFGLCDHDGDGIGTAKGRHAAKQLVEDATDAIEVGGRANLVVFVARLFGCHINWGADDHSIARDAHVVFVGAKCQAEIHQFGAQDPVFVFGDEDVIGLEISVNEPVRVRLAERLEDVVEQDHDFVERVPEQASGAKRLPVDLFHENIRVARRHLTDVVDLHDVGVNELSKIADFALETRHRHTREPGLVTDDLERTNPVDARIVHRPNDTHSAFTETAHRLEI